LEEEAAAKRRLADEYDAAQERGEIAAHGRNSDVQLGNVTPASAADIGISRKAIHEARIIRDAESNAPGVVKAALDEAVAPSAKGQLHFPTPDLRCKDGGILNR
jgi:hypothetical protein